jgi:hypothetical protein
MSAVSSGHNYLHVHDPKLSGINHFLGFALYAYSDLGALDASLAVPIQISVMRPEKSGSSGNVDALPRLFITRGFFRNWSVLLA